MGPIASGACAGTSREPLSAAEKLDLLEDRLLRGDITEETYREIKGRLGSN